MAEPSVQDQARAHMVNTGHEMHGIDAFYSACKDCEFVAERTQPMGAVTLWKTKPAQIEAVYWGGLDEDYRVLRAFAPVTKDADGNLLLNAGKNKASGWIPVPTGNWIARNVDDHTDYWPIDSEHFERRYESA